jgi:HSP20 family protein
MSTLEQLRQSLGRTLETLGEGWQRLRDRAGQALTRFRPLSRREDVDTWEDQVMQSAAGWGFLATEIQEDRDRLRVRLEVPGMEAEDFDIDVVDNILVVRGEKRVRKEQREGRFHVMECAYGSFERAIPLPVEVKGHEASAQYRRGVLTVELPKHERSRSRRITVQSV